MIYNVENNYILYVKEWFGLDLFYMLFDWREKFNVGDSY